ncbi:MAG: lactate utilization protein [Ruminococcus sp.]|nr:lactate utilization protein [Ruminococcus sp.]
MTTVMESIIKKTMENLQKNNIKPFYVEKKEDVLPLIRTLVNEGDTVSNGGSVTLKQTGVMDELKSGRYNYLDRSREGITPEEIEQVYRDTYSADVYFASSNAITESGYLYNVDGNSNRVSAILYGPKSVVLVCGYNKIVKDLDEAVKRVKTCAAPPNTVRLNCETYCAEKGSCVSMNIDGGEYCDGCHSKDRICCNFVISAQQRHIDRIKVIIVGEELGY